MNPEKVYLLSTLLSNIKAFTTTCLHCRQLMWRSFRFRLALRSTGRSQMTLFNSIISILHMAQWWKLCSYAARQPLYVRMVLTTANTSAEQADTAIIDCCAAFVVPKMLTSDSPTHLKNETLSRLRKSLRVPHHSTLPYTPWPNRGIERLGQEMFRVFRYITSEYLMQPTKWIHLLPIVKHILNNALSPQRKNIPPVTVFTGR